MKKHLHNSLRALFLSLAVLLSLPMLAEKVEIEGIWYNLESEGKQAEVTYKGSFYDEYDEYSGVVVIPASVVYNGTTYSVTSIGDWAFSWCESLTSVTIPNSVTSIGEYAFYECSGLTSVTIGNSVESIGDVAFCWCESLTSVTIPNSVTSIGKSVFSECSGLTSVTIGNSVESIGDGAFSSCTGLTSVTIPNSVTSIGSSAFCDCSGLTSVTIPNSVTSIGKLVFGRCYGLKGINVEDGNKTFDSREGCNAIIETSSNILLYGCQTTVIPNSVTSIGEDAFLGCSGLTSVTIPNSVTSIGDDAFCACNGLTSVTIGNSVTSIGERAFEGCLGLTSVTIPNSVTRIGQTAFYDCSGLMSITIGNSVTSIGDYAFYFCDGLKSVHISDIEAWCEIKFAGYYSNPLYNAHHLYLNGEEVKELSIPNSVTSIVDYTFMGCSGLTSVTIPNSVTSIGDGAFYGCSGLTSVTIPNSVTSIGDNAFERCYGLTSVTIGNSVTSIGESAFYCCSKLTDVYCYAENVPSTNSNAFDYSYPWNATLHVPEASVDSYKETEPWSSFGTITALKEDLTLADGEEFENVEEKVYSTLTYTRTLSNTNTWNALYVPFEIPMTAEFCQNYDVAYFNDVHCYDNYVGEKENGVLGQDGVIDGMDMEVLKAQEGSVLNANYPYLIRAKNTDALNMNIKVEDATLYSAKETTISCSSVFMKFDVTGIYTTQTAGELKGEYDVYAISGGGWKQALNANQQLKPFRLYLKLTSIDGSPVKATESAMSRINIRMQGDDTETGIDELKTENGNVKSEIFDLSGRRVQKAQKGIFIQNGKKVIM